MRAFGVSNHTPRQTGLLKTAAEQPILINQLQLSGYNIPQAALAGHGQRHVVALQLDTWPSRSFSVLGTSKTCRHKAFVALAEAHCGGKGWKHRHVAVWWLLRSIHI